MIKFYTNIWMWDIKGYIDFTTVEMCLKNFFLTKLTPVERHWRFPWGPSPDKDNTGTQHVKQHTGTKQVLATRYTTGVHNKNFRKTTGDKLQVKNKLG